LQLLQILIVSLLMLHIIHRWCCFAQITPLADLSSVSLDFFQFISLSHYTVPLLQRQHHNTRKKRKFNKNAAANEQLTVNISSKFSTILLKLLVLVETTIKRYLSCLAISCPAFSCPSFSASRINLCLCCVVL